MRGAIPPLQNTLSWRGAQLKKCTESNLPLLYLTSERRHRHKISYYRILYEMSLHFHTPATLSQNCPGCTLDRILGGLQVHSG